MLQPIWFVVFTSFLVIHCQTSGTSLSTNELRADQYKLIAKVFISNQTRSILQKQGESKKQISSWNDKQCIQLIEDHMLFTDSPELKEDLTVTDKKVWVSKGPCPLDSDGNIKALDYADVAFELDVRGQTLENGEVDKQVFVLELPGTVAMVQSEMEAVGKISLKDDQVEVLDLCTGEQFSKHCKLDVNPDNGFIEGIELVEIARVPDLYDQLQIE